MSEVEIPVFVPASPPGRPRIKQAGGRTISVIINVEAQNVLRKYKESGGNNLTALIQSLILKFGEENGF